MIGSVVHSFLPRRGTSICPGFMRPGDAVSHVYFTPKEQLAGLKYSVLVLLSQVCVSSRRQLNTPLGLEFF